MKRREFAIQMYSYARNGDNAMNNWYLLTVAPAKYPVIDPMSSIHSTDAVGIAVWLRNVAFED